MRAVHDLSHRLDDFRVPVAQDIRAPAECVVNVDVVIHIFETASPSIFEEERDRRLATERTADSSG
jgi:hypothetical protein